MALYPLGSPLTLHLYFPLNTSQRGKRSYSEVEAVRIVCGDVVKCVFDQCVKTSNVLFAAWLLRRGRDIGSTFRSFYGNVDLRTNREPEAELERKAAASEVPQTLGQEQIGFGAVELVKFLRLHQPHFLPLGEV